MTPQPDTASPAPPRPDTAPRYGDLALLTVPELCELWGVNKQWVYAKAASKELKSVKIGNLLRFRFSDLEEYINAAAA